MDMFRFGKKNKETQSQTDAGDGAKERIPSRTGIPSRISECEKLVQDIFKGSSDIVIQTFETHRDAAMLVYVDGLANKDLIDRDIIQPFKSPEFDGNISLTLKALFRVTDDPAVFVDAVLDGNVAVFYEKAKKIFIIEIKAWATRSVTEPDAETVVRGPKEGFTESFRTNTAMMRRKIKTPRLIIEDFTLGRQTKTLVGLIYIDGIVNRDVLEEVKRRLSKIDVDLVLESGHIEQHICENTFAPVSGIGLSQKPDTVAQKILEGRVAILCDGTPHVLIIPDLFIENLTTSEDYYNRTVFSSVIRILRASALFITILLPGMSVAVITYHPEMIPSVFFTSIISSSQKTPMPIAAEVLLLTAMFELIRESGSRLPKAVGSAITIVGSLIIGEAAVSAGIISEPMVIVVALTALSSFMAPNLLEFVLVYRAFFWFLGTIMGLIGIGSGIFIMLTQLISTSSFGIPILSSFSKTELKDAFVRFPLPSLKFRPPSIAKENVKRKK